MKACVVVFPGSNGDRDLLEALQVAGFEAAPHPSDEALPADCALVALPGGFSFGDYWRAGALARQSTAVRTLPKWLEGGGLCIGICNGFQILVETGVLPGALGANEPSGFRHAWSTLEVTDASSPWFSGFKEGAVLRLPIAHGEGRYLPPEAGLGLARAALTYQRETNGSWLRLAGLTDATGRVLGLMPHPERAIDKAQGSADGLALFTSAFHWLKDNPPRLIALTTALSPLSADAAQELAARVGLSPEELVAARTGLMREPTRTELCMLAGMWSEHCSYKSSRPLLATLPKESAHVLAGPGSHAGVIDAGDGWGLAFKIESHNHPSAVEPYQGAATGVGGILRDIIAQGARPIALLDSLCFGMPDNARTVRLRDGVVAGIGGYGNAIGVPNVGGLTRYHPRYQNNPLVNAMGIGLVRHDALRTSATNQPDAALVYVGAATGRDGVLGAAFASENLSGNDTHKRPQVQVGDPFAGKKLLEACLAFGPQDGLLACQDLGAAGLTCAVTEMAATSQSGAFVDLACVPLREAGMSSEDILVSETQERFLFSVTPSKAHAAAKAFRAQGLEAAVIGHLVPGGRVRVWHEGAWVADIPAALVAGGAPLRRSTAAELPRPIPYIDPSPVPPPLQSLEALLKDPSLGSAHGVYSGFDQTVGNLTCKGPGQADAAVMRLPGSTRGFAACITGDGPTCAAAPFEGTQAALALALRKLSCVGARFVAVTDGINHGAPTDPVEFARLKAVIDGLGAGLRTLGVPVTGGNVSLFNQSPSGPIPPTPMIGAIGRLDDVRLSAGYALQAGQTLVFLGAWSAARGYCRWAEGLFPDSAGNAAEVDLPSDMRLASLLVEVVSRGCLPVARAVGPGGVLLALSKLCLTSGVGAQVELPASDGEGWAFFGEHPAQAWVACSPSEFAVLESLAHKHRVPLHVAGLAGGGKLSVRGVLDVSLEILSQWNSGRSAHANA